MIFLKYNYFQKLYGLQTRTVKKFAVAKTLYLYTFTYTINETHIIVYITYYETGKFSLCESKPKQSFILITKPSHKDS